MINLSEPNNEWLAVEIKLCRSILGLSQQQLAIAADLSAQSIKRLEKKGAKARYTTVLNLRKTFSDLGVHVRFDEQGVITANLDGDLIDAINQGKLESYINIRLLDKDCE